MADSTMLHIINPQFFKWVIQWISPDQYIAHAYPTQDGANMVPLKSFVDIIGDLRELKPGFDGDNSISNSINFFNFGNYGDNLFYASLEVEPVEKPETEEDFAQFIESDTVFREVRYLGSMDRYDRYSLQVEHNMEYIIAQKCTGYVQPIQKRCVYDILKGSIVSLKNLNSIVYLHVTGGMILPSIQSIGRGVGIFASWNEYSLTWDDDENRAFFVRLGSSVKSTVFQDNHPEIWERATRKKPLFPDPWKD